MTTKRRAKRHFTPGPKLARPRLAILGWRIRYYEPTYGMHEFIETTHTRGKAPSFVSLQAERRTRSPHAPAPSAQARRSSSRARRSRPHPRRGFDGAPRHEVSARRSRRSDASRPWVKQDHSSTTTFGRHRLTPPVPATRRVLRSAAHLDRLPHERAGVIRLGVHAPDLDVLTTLRGNRDHALLLPRRPGRF